LAARNGSLFNEHHEEYQTLWIGNGGRVYFYQSEIPYDAPDQPATRSLRQLLGQRVGGYDAVPCML
jgi:hypothetical protein